LWQEERAPVRTIMTIAKAGPFEPITNREFSINYVALARVPEDSH